MHTQLRPTSNQEPPLDQSHKRWVIEGGRVGNTSLVRLGLTHDSAHTVGNFDPNAMTNSWNMARD